MEFRRKIIIDMTVKELLKEAFEIGMNFKSDFEDGNDCIGFEKWYDNLDKSLLPVVNRSLPNLEERNFEVKRLTDKLYKEDDYFGKSNFTQGFRAAFVWLNSKPSENG